jgi:TolA-binding protein
VIRARRSLDLSALRPRGPGRVVVAGALLAGPLLASGCATYSEAEGKRLETQVYALQAQLEKLEKTTRDSATTQDAQLADLDKKTDNLQTVAFRNSADFGVQLDTALQEVARLKGLVESWRERLDDIDSKLARTSEEMKISEEKRAQNTTSEDQKKAAVEEAIKREQMLSNPGAVVDEVVRLLNAQKPGDARKLLREFTQRAETNERLKKDLDQIQYLLAETYFFEANYQLAATEYNKVRKDFPRSDKVPEALYKLGQCFERLKLPEDAKLFYKTVVEKHAKSDAAKRAKERLKELK